MTGNPPLLGYCDRMSARPGDTVEFKVSSTSEKPFTAHLVRSICADPNPAGPGIVEEDASAYFARQSCPSVEQPFHAGSYAVSKTVVDAKPQRDIEISVMIFPTLVSGRVQNILGFGQHDLQIDENGTLRLSSGGRVAAMTAPLKIRRWYRIEARIGTEAMTLECTSLEPKGAKPVQVQATGSSDLAVSVVVSIGARIRGEDASQHFNGKIEAPVIRVDGDMIAAWDFSQDIRTTHVPAETGPMLSLVNYPTRAVTGSCWDGSEMNWTHKPAHYAAIHFHDDDIYNFGWETSFTFTIPADMPSGAYVMRLECDAHADAVPFFVCPAKGKRTADLCVIIPTFTYAIYGNHARPDYDRSWQKRMADWSAYPHNPAEYPQYGLSTYNYHSDGSGICHASHKRPLFNMRPGYLTFGAASCSGLRHFQADTHLISWLHAKGIAYDIVTDREIHDEGIASLAGYKAVTSTTHPEYHTSETLDALRDYRDTGGNLLYLGGNGFYWRIGIHSKNPDMLEIRRAEDGIRAWAAEPGEYYNAFDGAYGGLWRRNGRAPQELVGIGFTAQGEFFGDPYRRTCHDPAFDWVFEGIEGDILGDFGLSGHGAAGFELDHMDHRIGTPDEAVLLARSVTRGDGFMLVPEEQLTHLTNLTGGPEADAKHADMIYAPYPGGGSIFSVGSITFCGSLPSNDFDNNISRLLGNVLGRYLS